MTPNEVSLGKGDAVFKTENFKGSFSGPTIYGHLCDDECDGGKHHINNLTSTDPSFKVVSHNGKNFKVVKDRESILCDRCQGPVPMGYEVPPVPIGGWMKEMRKDIAEIKRILRKESHA